ncbi:MAG: hypothetical protein CVV41_08040 [Candidatus Riflebacteria bacterium HGW-Riflebacteria-1]|jgi:hypothetical protein|nr:MAG: hypothetical protein CVV41_08040 [Candidatus Riflebacteria bacterium HGW-Riflebacteria-1]
MRTISRISQLIVLMFLLLTFAAANHAWCQEAGDNGQMASIDEVLGNSTAKDKNGTIALSSGSPGSKTYVAAADCEVIISSCLQTYGNAELSVTVNDEKVISWARSSDRDPAKLMVRGKEISESNVDVGGGDFTPTTQKTRLSLKKGDKVILNLSGNFGRAEAHLSLNGPGIESKAPVPGEIGGGDGTIVKGEGGGFLWKPVSESRGGVAVILLPPKYRHVMFNRKISINGSTNEVLEWRDTYANGNRMHIFLKKKGAQYGGPVTITLELAKGGSIEWKVADAAKRTER